MTRLAGGGLSSLCWELACESSPAPVGCGNVQPFPCQLGMNSFTKAHLPASKFTDPFACPKGLFSFFFLLSFNEQNDGEKERGRGWEEGRKKRRKGIGKKKGREAGRMIKSIAAQMPYNTKLSACHSSPPLPDSEPQRLSKLTYHSLPKDQPLV